MDARAHWFPEGMPSVGDVLFMNIESGGGLLTGWVQVTEVDAASGLFTTVAYPRLPIDLDLFYGLEGE